jgi:hypothetical protein
MASNKTTNATINGQNAMMPEKGLEGMFNVMVNSGNILAEYPPSIEAKKLKAKKIMVLIFSLYNANIRLNLTRFIKT